MLQINFFNQQNQPKIKVPSNLAVVVENEWQNYMISVPATLKYKKKNSELIHSIRNTTPADLSPKRMPAEKLEEEKPAKQARYFTDKLTNDFEFSDEDNNYSEESESEAVQEDELEQQPSVFLDTII